MRTADFSLKVKALQETGVFTGLASSYAGLDLMGDTVSPGAFAQAIKSQGPYGYPLLWNHDSGSPIGIARVSDSREGLVVNGELVLSDPIAQKTYAHLQAKSVRGISIGYQDVKSEPQAGGGRLLKEIKLYEISLCAIPADPRATVASVKSAAAVLANLRSDSLSTEDRAALTAVLKQLLGKDLDCECDCRACVGGDCEECSNEECQDPNCEGHDRNRAATLAALKELAAELRA